MRIYKLTGDVCCGGEATIGEEIVLSPDTLGYAQLEANTETVPPGKGYPFKADGEMYVAFVDLPREIQ